MVSARSCHFPRNRVHARRERPVLEHNAVNVRAGLIGLVAAVLGVVLTLLYLQRAERELSGGRTVQVLVALDTIPRGASITEAMLGTRDVPVAYVDDRVLRAADKSKILNLPATNTILVQQSIAWSDVLLPKDDARPLSTLVQPGNRAAPLLVRISDSLPLVQPGDFVDVLCVCGDAKEASVLLQRVLVLANGVNTSVVQGAKDTRHHVRVITVSVSLAESQLLALAMEKGELTVVVRNAQDQRITDSPVDVTLADLGDAARRPAFQSSRRAAPAGPTPVKMVPVR